MYRGAERFRAIATSLVRTAGFAAVYAAAIMVGRLTVVADTRLALVWPASGVAAAWLCSRRRSRAWWVDAAALTAIAWAGNAVTGAGLALSGVLAVANLAMAVMFMWLLGRLRPTLWGGGGSRRLSSGWELGSLLGVAIVAAAVGAVIGLTGLWLITGHGSSIMLADWMARHVTGMFVIGSAGLWFGRVFAGMAARSTSPRWWWRTLDGAVRAMPGRRVGEYLAVVVGSVLAYLVGFVYDGGLPLAFPLIAVTVWAALRLCTNFVVLHNLALGGVAVLCTWCGMGPLAAVGDPYVRALVAQLFVLLITTVGLILALGRDERAELLAALTAQKEQAARHGALMDAIIDSMADGLSLVDAEGRVVLRNPAGKRLFGAAATVGEAGRRMRHLDGSPVTADALPTARALAGEKTGPVDLLVMDPDSQDTRVVRVCATPLPDGEGARRAVVLYQDVTAERRHRDQLAGFAGSVAHDLQNPLTTVEGWTEVATDALDTAGAGPGLDRARDSLGRVTRAAARMRGLITDLLVYTAARDEDLTPARVDLTDLVDDIAAARTDAAIASGEPAPRVTVGELDPVHADAAAVRQLLDNLVGNAIKYTGAGVTPQVSVTSIGLGDMVQVTVADNGIGIPAGQHEAIFDDFHRAHPGTGYTGTGLGLAICHRIATRHGGGITAHDNPGGGSRFIFTLPATDRLGALAEVAAPLILPTAPAGASRPAPTIATLAHAA
ncbi:ATP-binding protein [Actinoplanes regularis]|uniref:ATP-binding protein n=1 Tax=Actinoplanes regularis TaxID=52697 RepID=UPI001A50C114|nr:ATP-binding protein [Actinoplanes regularis]GIE85660.1 hypothetical protein Are01nite_21400 [Actinoplanes regularis]